MYLSTEMHQCMKFQLYLSESPSMDSVVATISLVFDMVLLTSSDLTNTYHYQNDDKYDDDDDDDDDDDNNDNNDYT